MSSTRLSGAVAAYIDAANSQNTDAAAACFAEDAIVKDEGREMHGIAAIREWANDVIEKYRPILDVVDAQEANGRTIVTGRVSGNFPGSPIDLRYVFVVRARKISVLEIS